MNLDAQFDRHFASANNNVCIFKCKQRATQVDTQRTVSSPHIIILCTVVVVVVALAVSAQAFSRRAILDLALHCPYKTNNYCI